MSTPFAAPAAPGEGITWSELNGSLLLIDVLGVETGINTSLGAKDAVRANVAVLDGAQAGTEYPDALIFPKVLGSQLRARVGQKVLGRLGQGQAKPGQSAPWLLSEATPADQQVGMAWLQRQVTPPAPPVQEQPSYPPAAAMGQPVQQGAGWPPSQQPAAAQEVPF